MPRFARRTVAGAVVHLIARVVDHEFRIDDHARAEYLLRVARVAPRARWQLLAYAIMSNHVHWLLRCLGVPIRELIHPLHTGFGNWLNNRDGRLGHVFAQRPATYLFEPHETARLIAYIHNNPVRAGVVETARESDWTSHRAYVGDAPAPRWLDVSTGLVLSETEDTAAGRSSFDDMVRARADEPRDSLYGGDRMSRARRELRKQLNSPVQIGTPLVTSDQVSFPLLGAEGMPIREPWEGSIEDIIVEVAQATGLRPERLRSRSRNHNVAQARRLVVLLASEHLGRSISEACAALGLSASAGSKLLHRAQGKRDELSTVAAEIGARLRARGKNRS